MFPIRKRMPETCLRGLCGVSSSLQVCSVCLSIVRIVSEVLEKSVNPWCSARVSWAWVTPSVASAGQGGTRNWGPKVPDSLTKRTFVGLVDCYFRKGDQEDKRKGVGTIFFPDHLLSGARSGRWEWGAGCEKSLRKKIDFEK